MQNEEDEGREEDLEDSGSTPEDDRFYAMGGCALVSAQVTMMLVGFCSQFNAASLTVGGNSNAAAGRSSAMTYLVVTTIIGVLLLAFLNRGKGRDPVALYVLPIMIMLMALVLISK